MALCGLGGIVGFGLPQPGQHEVYAALAIRDDGDTASAQSDQLLSEAEHLMYRTINEDKDILNTIHYRPGHLTRGDRTLSEYIQFLRGFPRAHPAGPFIR